MWLLSSLLLLAGGAVAGESVLSGPHRFYAGRTAERRLTRMLEGAGPVRWRLRAFGALIAESAQEVDAADPILRIEVPRAARRFFASLSLEREGGLRAEVRVEICPSRWEEVQHSLSVERIGLLGPRPAFLADLEGLVALPTAGAVRRFPGRLVLLAPGDWPVAAHVPALLDRVTRGARVVDLGADSAPWVDAEGPRGEAELARARPLHPGSGNHREAWEGAVREAFIGTGRLVLARLRIAESIESDPLAEECLLDLLARALADVPPLRSPAAVLVIGDERDAFLGEAFAPEAAGEVRIVSSFVEGAESWAKKEPSVLAGPDRSVYFGEGEEREGPGFQDRPAFLRFVTDLNIRVRETMPWRGSCGGK